MGWMLVRFDYETYEGIEKRRIAKAWEL